MATLNNNTGLKVEIKFDDFVPQPNLVIGYFEFSYDNLPVFNSEVSKSRVYFNDYGEESTLIATLEDALSLKDKNARVSWEPIEPDLLFEAKHLIYRDLQSYIEFTFVIDTYEFNKKPNLESRGYSGDGLGFRITVTKKQLEDFVKELKNDYEEFFRKKEAIEKERIARKLQKSKTRNSE